MKNWIENIFKREDIQEVNEKQKIAKFNKTIILAIMIIGTILQIVLIFNEGAWSDEAFTMLTVKNRFSKMWQILISDVHPPLYYIILKAAFSVTGISLQIAKLVSIAPIFLLNLMIIFFVFRDKEKIESKVTGILVAIFIAVTTLTKSFLHAAVEVRMYSWALFFVTMSGIYAYKTYNNASNKNIIIFIILSLGAAFTHYFALIMEVLIYCYLFIMLLIKDRNNISKILTIIDITVISYIWWLPTAIEQFKRVKQAYWITFEKQDIIEYFTTIFNFNFIVTIILLAIILGACLYKLFIKKDLKDKEKEEMVFGTCCVTMPILTIIIGMILNVIIRPVFVARYLIPSIGLLWLGIFIMIKYVDYKNIIKYLVRFFSFDNVYSTISNDV